MLNVLLLNNRQNRLRVSLPSGEWIWVGTPGEIVKQMAALNYGGPDRYMEKVKKRIKKLGLEIRFQSRYRFLMELQRIGFVNIEPNKPK